MGPQQWRIDSKIYRQDTVIIKPFVLTEKDSHLPNQFYRKSSNLIKFYISYTFQIPKFTLEPW